FRRVLFRSGEHGVGIALDGWNVGPEILRAERHPYLLDDLATAILESFLKAADLFVTEGIIGRDRDNALVAIIAGPLPEWVVRLRRHPTGEHEIRIFVDLPLREVVSCGDRADVKHLLGSGDRCQGVSRRR